MLLRIKKKKLGVELKNYQPQSLKNKFETSKNINQNLKN